MLAELREKLLLWKEQLLPRHPMAEAIHYALAEWTELNVFCSDGAVPIDNNVSEREMKRVVLNRKNSLFVGNPRRTHGRHLGQPDLDLSQTRHRPATVSHPVADQIASARTSELTAWLPDQWKLISASRC